MISIPIATLRSIVDDVIATCEKTERKINACSAICTWQSLDGMGPPWDKLSDEEKREFHFFNREEMRKLKDDQRQCSILLNDLVARMRPHLRESISSSSGSQSSILLSGGATSSGSQSSSSRARVVNAPTPPPAELSPHVAAEIDLASNTSSVTSPDEADESL